MLAMDQSREANPPNGSWILYWPPNIHYIERYPANGLSGACVWFRYRSGDPTRAWDGIGKACVKVCGIATAIAHTMKF